MKDLNALIRPVVEKMGYIFWGMEFLPFGRRAKLRVLIDKEQGINLDDCSAVSEQISMLLDVENPISQSYVLEVSSPGLDRPLFELNHYKTHIGEKLKVVTHRSIDGRKKFTGVLEAVDTDSIALRSEGDLIQIALGSIRSAHLIFEGSVGDSHLKAG